MAFQSPGSGQEFAAARINKQNGLVTAAQFLPLRLCSRSNHPQRFMFQALSRRFMGPLNFVLDHKRTSMSYPLSLIILPLILIVPISSAEISRSIGVVGKANIKVMADAFAINGRVACINKSNIKDADDEVQRIFDGLSQLMGGKGLGISGRSTTKKYNRNNGNDEFEGYESSIYFSLKTTDISQYREYYKKLLSNNSTEISGVEYQYSKQIEAREKMRSMALLAAQEKAGKMAATLGAKIGMVISISETQNNYYDNRYMNSTVNNVMTDDEMKLELVEGELSISSSVHVVFEIR